MKLGQRLILVAVGLTASTGAAFYRAETPSEMVQTASAFIASLTPEQLAKARIDFKDEEPGELAFHPPTQEGFAFQGNDPVQRKLAHAFLASGLSQRGYIKATTIMSLEQILYDLESQNPRRDVELYYFSVFGHPADSETWGWRVEGHHLSLNFVLKAGKITATTPSFWGANPARIMLGPRQGLRALGEEEDSPANCSCPLMPTRKRRL